MQVVLPMLDSAVVGPGWISEADFLTGIALVQAMPGPLFNFSAYVGKQCKFIVIGPAVPQHLQVEWVFTWILCMSVLVFSLLASKCKCHLFGFLF